MKLALVFCAAFSVASLASATAVHRPVEANHPGDTAIAVPAWLDLPNSEYITSIEHLGDPGDESSRGAVVFELPSDGQAEMAWLAEHYETRGYRLENRTSGLDQLVAATVVVDAVDGFSNRRITFQLTPAQDGTTLRVSFDDPPDEAEVSGL